VIARAQTAPVVLITGGKGGVGKTTIAANLGVLMATAGARALLVDLDLGLADLDVVLGMDPQLDLEDFLRGERSLEDCVVRGPGGVELLGGGAGSVDMANLSPDMRALLNDGIRRAALQRDIVVADGAAGIGMDVLDAGLQAQRVLVVTTPDPAAVTDAYGLLKAMDLHAREQGVDMPTPELFVNRAHDRDHAVAVAEGIRDVCERFLARRPCMAGWLPRSEEIEEATAARSPFVLDAPASLAARTLSGFAERLLTRLEGAAVAV